MLCSEKTDVDAAVDIGRRRTKEYENIWPNGFYQPLKKCVTTMAETPKHSNKVNSTTILDESFIYSRVMGLLAYREIHLPDLLSYELAQFPLSMFDSDGEMRISKSKSVMKRKLQVEVAVMSTKSQDAIILNACAILWIIYWPAHGTVRYYVNGFTRYVMTKLKQSNVHVIFDRNYEYSTKTGTRKAMSGKAAS